MSYERVITVNDVDFRVVFDASPLIPAQLYGPPEDCSPEEGGEIEILEIFIDVVEVSGVISKVVEADIQRQLEENVAEITEPEFDEPNNEPDYDND